MEGFVGLQSSFLLCVILALSEQAPVSVGYTSSTFWAVTEPTLFGQDRFLHSDEVSLGIGCPVTNITEKGYVFSYPVIECGIQKEVFLYGTIFYSALHYNKMHKGVTGKIPLMCMVSSSSSGDTPPGTTTTNSAKFRNGPPSANSHPPRSITNTFPFGLAWTPYLQDTSVQSSLPFLNMPHPLVHESANMATF